MLVRIFFDNRWIPVNLPDHAYSDRFTQELKDKLLIQLLNNQHIDQSRWMELQTIELELCPDGWKATLYRITTNEETEIFFFR